MKVMVKHTISCLSVFILATLAVVAIPLAAQPVEVRIIDRNGKNIGSAKITQAQSTQESSGVRIQMEVSGLSPGKHGLHIHSSGACEPPAFKSAGSHFSPRNHKHGFLDSEGPHEGDLPMLDVNSDGMVTGYDFTTTRVSLSRDSLQQSEGTSLIIHDKPDDYLTGTGGGTGDRIACGIIHPATNQQGSKKHD